MRVIFFGTYDERAHPRVRVLREGLTMRGCDVSVCNAPIAFDTAARVRLARQPWRAPAFGLRVLAAWLLLLWRSRAIRQPDVVVVGYLGSFDVHLARLRFPHAQVVLDQMVSLSETVRDRALDASGGLARALGRIDDAAARRADLVVLDTEEQAAALDPSHRAVVVPVGAARVWLDTTPVDDPAPDAAVRVVFFGLYTPLQGAPTIGQALALLPRGTDLTVTMIGTGQDRDATERAAASATVDITWSDWVDSEMLPDLVASHHVCLGIFGTNEKSARVVPNKVFQGAAAGAAIVTGDTSAQRRALDGAATFVPTGRPDLLAAALVDLAADRTTLAAARRRAREWAEVRVDPGHVVTPLLSELGSPASG